VTLIREYLQSRHVWFETLLHCPAPTASKRAKMVHITGRRVAKGVLVKAPGGDALVVLPATHRIDLERLAGVLGEKDVRIATENEVERVFANCELGALPPFGRMYGLRTVVDLSLDSTGEFVFLANTRHEGIRMRYRDYAAIEEPIHAPVALTPPSRPVVPDRRAG
jgi:Ala-tRNA(Pro) deacylase